MSLPPSSGSRPSGSVVRRTPTQRATVVAVDNVTPRMRRVTVQADTMRGVEIRPAQDVELLLREPSGRRVKRRYTIRSARAAYGELDLDVLLHGNDGAGGPGAQWAAGVGVRDEVEFQGPRGKLELRPALWHLLVGDESAIPAFAAICEALPAGELATAIVEVRDAHDEVPLVATARWLHRGDSPPGGSALLSDAVAQLALPGGSPGCAYLLGETRAMVALRAVLEGRGIPHDSIFVKGYWNVGRVDRLANRPPQ